jgi:hypothetical protein
MPRAIPLFAVLVVLALGGTTAYVSAHQIQSDEGPLPSMTGAPAVGAAPAEANCTYCHQDFDNPCAPEPCNFNAPGGGIEILGLPATYEPGQVIPLRVHLWSDSTLDDVEPLWGFEMTAVRTQDGAGAGRWEPGDPDTFAVVPGFGAFATRSYIEQTFFGARLGLHGGVEWTFNWRAPAEEAGDIVFYVAGVAGNGNDEPGAGDFVYTGNATTRSGVVSNRATTWGALKTRFR